MGRFCELVHLLGWRLLESFWTGLSVRTKPEDFVFLCRPAQGALAPHSQLSLSPFPCFSPCRVSLPASSGFARGVDSLLLNPCTLHLCTHALGSLRFENFPVQAVLSIVSLNPEGAIKKWLLGRSRHPVALSVLNSQLFPGFLSSPSLKSHFHALLRCSSAQGGPTSLAKMFPVHTPGSPQRVLGDMGRVLELSEFWRH